jgi:hypothetical protein
MNWADLTPPPFDDDPIPKYIFDPDPLLTKDINHSQQQSVVNSNVLHEAKCVRRRRTHSGKSHDTTTRRSNSTKSSNDTENKHIAKSQK